LVAGITGAAVLVAAVGSLAWRNVGPTGTPVEQTPAYTATRPLELISAELYTMRPRELVDTVRFTGTTQPVDQTVVKGRVAGRLAEVLVREGDGVVKGQLLARFEDRELRAKVDERESALQAARADARWAERDFADKEILAKSNIASRAALDAARSAAENKKSMVAVSEAQLEFVKSNLADSEVRAPFDGVVGERLANQGEALPIDGKILTLLDTSHVEIVAQMPAADVVRLKVGLPVSITLEGFGDRKFAGSIMRISPTTLVGSRSIPVYVEIADRDDALRGGLFGTGTVIVQQSAEALAVPIDALRKDEQGNFVLAVDNGVLVRKPVTVSRTWLRGELAEVKGLEVGTTIVAAALPGLKAGRAVTVTEIR
jgi:RND family efflux transporter MFP subunit